MPRYFFHVEDGVSMPDIEGTVLPDLDAAREEAVRLAGALLSEHPREFWNGARWRLEVHHEQHGVLLTLSFLAEDRSKPAAG